MKLNKKILSIAPILTALGCAGPLPPLSSAVGAAGKTSQPIVVEGGELTDVEARPHRETMSAGSAEFMGNTVRATSHDTGKFVKGSSGKLEIASARPMDLNCTFRNESVAAAKGVTQITLDAGTIVADVPKQYLQGSYANGHNPYVHEGKNSVSVQQGGQTVTLNDNVAVFTRCTFGLSR